MQVHENWSQEITWGMTLIGLAGLLVGGLELVYSVQIIDAMRSELIFVAGLGLTVLGVCRHLNVHIRFFQ